MAPAGRALTALRPACSETETWQCLLCVNFAELAPGEAERERRLMERLTLELYCQYEPSLALREPHGPAPTCLDAIRGRLQPRHPQRYTQLQHYVADVRLLFRNVYRYNSVRLATLGTRRYARTRPYYSALCPQADSSIYKDAKRLEEFFDAQLLKWLPEYAYWGGDGEPPSKRPRPDLALPAPH